MQILRGEYWDKLKNVDPENLIFWHKMGILLGLTRTRARSGYGGIVYDLKPFELGAKITVFGAISLKKVVGIMTIDGSMDGKAFSVFIEHFLVPNLGDSAVEVN